MSSVKTYQKEMRRFGYRATWEPNAPIRLGAVGKLHAGAFLPYTSLEKLGIDVETDVSTGEGTLKHNTEGGVNFTTKAAGELSESVQFIDDAKAGLVIEFTADRAVAFAANQTTNHQISNLEEVERKILGLYNEGKWKKDYVVVTNLITAESTTVFIGRSAGAKVELEAAADVNLAKIDLADAEGKLSLAGKKKLETEILGEKGLSPLYRVMGVNRGFLGLGAGRLDIKALEPGATETTLVEIPADDDEFDLH